MTRRRCRNAGFMVMTAAVAGALSVCMPQEAFALSQDSTMSEWTDASAADKKGLLEALGPRLTPSFKTEEADILACIDSAAQSSAHANLPIGEIAKACAEAAEPATQAPSHDI